MPGFVTVQHRDVYVLVEFSLDEINKINKIMELIEIKYDGDKKEEKEAEEYFIKKFYPFFEKLQKEMEQHAPNAK